MDKQYISWDDVFHICDVNVERFKFMDFTDIIAIARGGLMPAQLIAHQLGIRRVHSLGITFYEKDNPEGMRKIPITYQLLTSNLENARVLVVDEIADSGATFIHAINYLHIINPSLTFKTFAMYYKGCSVYTPDYIGKTVPSEKWLQMPYEV